MFTYMSKGEPTAYGFLPAGVYPATVMGVEEQVARQSGNPMLVVSLKAVGAEGTATVKYYLTLTEKAIWKIDQFVYAIGLTPKAGEAVTLDQRIVGRRCFVRLGVDKGEKQDFNKCEDVIGMAEGEMMAAAGRRDSRDPFPEVADKPGPYGAQHVEGDDIPF